MKPKSILCLSTRWEFGCLFLQDLGLSYLLQVQLLIKAVKAVELSTGTARVVHTTLLSTMCIYAESYCHLANRKFLSSASQFSFGGRI